MLELIVFDWDDVFTIGSTEAYHACYIKAARDAGATTDENEIVAVVDKLWGRPHETVIRSYLGDEDSLFDEVNKNYEKYIHTDVFLDHLEIVDGSLEMISRLQEKYLLAVVSGINPSLLKEKVFPKFSVPDVFSKIITSSELEDISKGKPHPHMLEMVLKSLKIRPENTIHVGDAPGDVLMAQAAGVMPVVVLTGQLNEMSAKKLGVQYILNNVTELESRLPDLAILND